MDKRKTQGSESTTPPASPGVIPRLRAIRCKSSVISSRGRQTARGSVLCVLGLKSSFCGCPVSDAHRRLQDVGPQRSVQEGRPVGQQEERAHLGSELHPPEGKSRRGGKVRGQVCYFKEILKEIWGWEGLNAVVTCRKQSCLPSPYTD